MFIAEFNKVFRTKFLATVPKCQNRFLLKYIHPCFLRPHIIHRQTYASESTDNNLFASKRGGSDCDKHPSSVQS